MKKNSLVSYLSQILNLYRHIQKFNSESPSLKLIDCNIDSVTNQPSFVVQITGKNLFPTITSKDFLSDKSLITNFDKADQKIIYSVIKNLHHEAMSANRVRIVSKTFDRAKKEIVFTIEFYENNSIKRKNYSLNELPNVLANLHDISESDRLQIETEISNCLTAS